MSAIVAVLALPAIAGCGSSDFPNEPRAATPLETTASIGPKEVNVSPNRFGAGPTVITVANLSSDPATFQLKGPTNAASGEIQPNATTTLKTDLSQGTYQAIAGGATGIKPGVVHVGPPRKTSQNTLLEP
jgi:hypothetical protein